MDVAGRRCSGTHILSDPGTKDPEPSVFIHQSRISGVHSYKNDNITKSRIALIVNQSSIQLGMKPNKEVNNTAEVKR